MVLQIISITHNYINISHFLALLPTAMDYKPFHMLFVQLINLISTKIIMM